jgi:methionyl-tRNA synthetase
VPFPDWSELELEKHAHEITDLLGNFFMRITSKAINKRIAQAEQPTMTIADAAASLPQLGALADMTRALPAVWAKDMEKMEVGLALQSIVNILSLVGPSSLLLTTLN